MWTSQSRANTRIKRPRGERAFELARSGQEQGTSEIITRLKREGYETGRISGPMPIRQLSTLNKAHPGHLAQSRPVLKGDDLPDGRPHKIRGPKAALDRLTSGKRRSVTSRRLPQWHVPDDHMPPP